MSGTFTLGEIAERLGGEVHGDASVSISGVAPLDRATAGQISYCDSERHRKTLESTGASAVIMGRQSAAPEDQNIVRVAQTLVAWSRTVEWFHPRERRFTDVSPAAFIGEDCEIAEGVGIGPGVAIGDGVRIGKGTEIYPACTVGHGSVIGEECLLYSGVHIYHSCTVGSRAILHSGVVIGGDGYGFTQEQQDDPVEPVLHVKIPQVGIVVVEDDVEIGANSTIDRAALGATVIGKGTKIDNHVIVAHNCVIGPHCLLVAQVGIAGSVDVGAYVTMGGQAGVAGHLTIGPRVVIAAQSGVTSNLPEGQVVAGTPAIEGGRARRAYTQIQFLPDLRKGLRSLEERVERLEKRDT